ncbi:hypothetical protein BD560DRAFT_486358 [Blakeslea trispora]|nr:hypothetical protein BD560DRAFT_486358 [Blakeslea trispora]
MLFVLRLVNNAPHFNQELFKKKHHCPNAKKKIEVYLKLEEKTLFTSPGRTFAGISGIYRTGRAFAILLFLTVLINRHLPLPENPFKHNERFKAKPLWLLSAMGSNTRNKSHMPLLKLKECLLTVLKSLGMDTMKTTSRRCLSHAKSAVYRTLTE